jgi:hypothetical protein
MTTKKQTDDPQVVFQLTVEFPIVDREFMEAITELIEKSREYGRPISATLCGLPSTLDIPV